MGIQLTTPPGATLADKGFPWPLVAGKSQAKNADIFRSAVRARPGESLKFYGLSFLSGLPETECLRAKASRIPVLRSRFIRHSTATGKSGVARSHAWCIVLRKQVT